MILSSGGRPTAGPVTRPLESRGLRVQVPKIPKDSVEWSELLLLPLPLSGPRTRNICWRQLLTLWQSHLLWRPSWWALQSPVNGHRLVKDDHPLSLFPTLCRAFPPQATYVVSATAPSAATIAILAGGPLCWGGIRVLALAGHGSNGIEHLRGHVLGQGVHSPRQICKHKRWR